MTAKLFHLPRRSPTITVGLQGGTFLGVVLEEALHSEALPAETAELLDRLAASTANGDRVAFERIYSLTVDDLFIYVRGQCRSESASEDIVSNAYYKAWRSAHRYHVGSNGYRKWLFGIARNELRNYWASNQPSVDISDLDLPAEDEYEASHAQSDARREVSRLLDTLTEQQRQVVVLRYFNNKSHEEIARIMGKREGAVRALLVRALRHMRKVMGDAAP